ncbi:MAG: MBL fold metallo-hydrolase, partial [Gemmatimonadales bacterium]|nr:MBL fold metallo-hydrolase [Gemmatimonadales bacterium]
GADNPLREALRRWTWAVAAGLWAVLLWSARPASADEPSALALHFLDVGQGDAAVIRTPGGHWVLIDAGPRDERRDAGRAVVAPFLLRHGARRLAVAVLSHAHLDHLGGLAAVLDRIPAAVVLEPGEMTADPLYTSLLDRLGAKAIRWRAGRPGDQFALDGVRFSVLHPAPSWAEWGEDLNEDSLVLLVEYGSFQAIFAGDAGFPAESLMAPRLRPVDLLKVGHHGSRGSSSDLWLSRLRPRAAVISVGRGNRYGHPTPEAVARLTRAGTRVWRTDRDGTVTVTTDGRQMTVLTRDGRAEFDVN